MPGFALSSNAKCWVKNNVTERKALIIFYIVRKLNSSFIFFKELIIMANLPSICTKFTLFDANKPLTDTIFVVFLIFISVVPRDGD